MYDFNTVIGTQTEKPAEIDTTSSQYVVYIRKDIEKYEHTDDQGVTVKGWKYKECVVPNNEYLVEKMTEQKETTEALMLGLCDLYEMNLGV